MTRRIIEQEAIPATGARPRPMAHEAFIAANSEVDTMLEDDWTVEPRGARMMKGIREPVAVFGVNAAA